MSDQSSGSGGARGVPSEAGFNFLRVVLTVVVLAVIGGGAFMAYEYTQNMPETLYPVRGVVYLDGEPMPDGVVMTIHTEDGMPAIGPIQPDGSFELSTNGEPGAFGGVHKVRVAWTDGGFPPFSYISLDYGDPVKTPFTVTVDGSTSETPLKLELEGRREPPERPAGDGGGSRYPGPPQSANEDGEPTNTGNAEESAGRDSENSDPDKPVPAGESAAGNPATDESEDAEGSAAATVPESSESPDDGTDEQ